jgi:hypothetical protein
MTHREFLLALDKNIREGTADDDPSLGGGFEGTPEQAASFFVREVMESDRVESQVLAAMRFVG